MIMGTFTCTGMSWKKETKEAHVVGELFVKGILNMSWKKEKRN